MNKWMAIKVFVAKDYNNPSNNIQSVWECGDKLIPEVDKIVGNSNWYFIHYYHPTEIPEGPHVKIHVCNQNEDEFIKKLNDLIQQWVYELELDKTASGYEGEDD